MIATSALAVFALGMRHGADPDHLAAIDNLTRNAYERRPLLSRWVGTLFAGGHAVMVLAIAALVGLLGAHIGQHRQAIETIGTWVSIVVLLLIAAANLRQLAAPGATRITGIKTRLLPAALRNATSPFVAVPIGLLFGFGFETSSQVATYALAFGIQAGVLGAIVIGLTFCFGMLVTDTLDSVLVHRLMSHRAGGCGAAGRAVRLWIWSVTIMALLVAGYELAQILGWQSPVPDFTVSAILIGSLFVVFASVFVLTRRERVASGASTLIAP